jgi:hypothetical protein
MDKKGIQGLLIVFLFFLLKPFGYGWGTYGHTSVTQAAILNLPYNMRTTFIPYQKWLDDTSTDAGVRTNWAPNETYFHYIDSDSNPACSWPFDCLPRDYGTYTTQYGVTNGVNPYIVNQVTYQLETAYRNWAANKTASRMTTALYWMARLSHYAADLNMPLHLTADYDPNNVHSRYETNMLNTYHPLVISQSGSGQIYKADIMAYCFSRMSARYPYYHTIAQADTTAENLDSSYGSTYYSSLWSQTRSFTTTMLNEAALDVSSLWYTAWTNAGLMTVPVELSEFTIEDYPVWEDRDTEPAHSR